MPELLAGRLERVGADEGALQFVHAFLGVRMPIIAIPQ